MEQHQQNHILEFSPDYKLFALINEHGILKIWDTETNELKQEYTPNLHLSCPCTCLTWITIKQKKSKKDRKSIENEQLKTFYLALGTSKGDVSLYSYAAGKIERNFQGDGHSGRINAIKSDNSNYLYTIGDDNQCIQWSLINEKKSLSFKLNTIVNSLEKPYSLAYLNDTKNLLIGLRQMLLYSLNSNEIVQTYNGHTSDIILITTFNHNSIEYAITASKMERILCLWKLIEGKKSKYKNCLCTFIMEDIAYSIDCKIERNNGNDNYDDDDNDNSSDNDGILKIIAVTRSGRIHVYVISMDSIKSEKPVKPKLTIEIISSDNTSYVEPISAIAAKFNFDDKNKEILIGYGDKHFLLFEQITLNFTEKVQTLIRNDPKKLYLKNTKSTSGKGQENILKTKTPFVDQNDVEYKTSGLISKKKMKTIQIPMETRLENLHLSNGEIPQAQSKVQLLMQALHSKDKNLLGNVLLTKDENVVQLTLKKLPVQYIEGLVNELTLLMEKKRSNVQTASIWLKVLIKTHTSQLMALGSNDLLMKFGPCLGIIEHRKNSLKELSKLSGRLQLLINQIKRNTEEEENMYSENVLVYEDKDSDIEPEDIEDKYLSGDDEWEENESEDDDNDDDDEADDSSSMSKEDENDDKMELD